MKNIQQRKIEYFSTQEKMDKLNISDEMNEKEKTIKADFQEVKTKN